MSMPKHSISIAKMVVKAALLGGLTSCASYTAQTAAMREAYLKGDYDLALESLKKSGMEHRSADRLLWRLEAATILDRKGETEKSRKLWFEADQIADELFTLSYSKTAASLIVNESSTDYDGEDYEKVAIHSMLAHQYIGEGKLDEARVEARKINSKLAEINQKYDKNSKNKYGEDAHARYISALIYEARGEWDSAIIDYTKAKELYEGPFATFISGTVPRGVILGLHRCLTIRGRADRLRELERQYRWALSGSTPAEWKDTGEIIVVHELGRIAPKVTREQFSTVGNQLVRFSSPALEPRPLLNAGTGVEISSAGFIPAENTAYLDMIARDTLENHRTRLVAKQTARLLAKGQINYQVQKNYGPLAGLAANVLTSALETADTRSWTTLPQAFYVTRARVRPGDQTVVVKTNGKMNFSKKVNIKSGQMQIFRGWD